MPDRIPCLVPFCRRTIARARLAPTHDEWIYAKHWRSVTSDAKARWRTLRRRSRRIGWAERCAAAAALSMTAEQDFRLARVWAAVRRAEARTWRRCKAEAIEATGGIG